MRRNRLMVMRVSRRPILHRGPFRDRVRVPVVVIFIIKVLISLGFVAMVTVLMLVKFVRVLCNVSLTAGITVLMRVWSVILGIILLNCMRLGMSSVMVLVNSAAFDIKLTFALLYEALTFNIKGSIGLILL